MLEKQSLSEEKVIGRLFSNYGIQVATLIYLPWGADTNASVYKAEAVDKACYFVKVKQGHHDNTSACLARQLFVAGIEQIIPPIPTMDSKYILAVDDFSLTLYPFVEGKNGFRRGKAAGNNALRILYLLS